MTDVHFTSVFSIDFFKENRTSIGVIMETWSKPEILDQEVEIYCYNILRSDRANRPRGGTAGYVKDLVAATKVPPTPMTRWRPSKLRLLDWRVPTQ